MKKSLLIIFLVLLADQVLKYYIKTNFILGQQYVFAKWFILNFVENNGMAFGLEFGGEFGKLALSLFRLVFIAAMGYYLFKKVVPTQNNYFIISLSFIFAGAVGNLIDSALYGILFSSSDYQLATFLPADGGYASFLHGKVVDMFYFPLWSGHYPSWFPFWKGQEFIFFRPVFNIADSSITVGVALMILFQSKVFVHEHHESQPEIKPELTSINQND